MKHISFHINKITPRKFEQEFRAEVEKHYHNVSQQIREKRILHHTKQQEKFDIGDDDDF